MTYRYLLASLLAVLCLAVAACGDDENEGGTSTNADGGSAKTLQDVEPRATKPNIVGGSGPIDQLLTTATGDATGYWSQVFQNSNLPYAEPTINVATAVTDDGCGGQFDPAQKLFFLCANEQASTINLSAAKMDNVRETSGDAAVVFLAGLWVAIDTNDQLSGRPIAKTGKMDQQFAATSACFAGAWIRNLADRNILEAGDDQEVLKTAEGAVGQGIGAQAVIKGYEQGAGACQGGEASSGGGTEEDGGGEQPPPSPSE